MEVLSWHDKLFPTVLLVTCEAAVRAVPEAGALPLKVTVYVAVTVCAAFPALSVEPEHVAVYVAEPEPVVALRARVAELATPESASVVEQSATGTEP
jgi:hypothetical protein